MKPNVKRMLAYNGAVFAAFVCVYAFLIADPREFDAPSGDKRDFGSAVYFAMVTHTTVGYGDIIARSGRARMLTAAHVALVFLGLVGAVKFDF